MAITHNSQMKKEGVILFWFGLFFIALAFWITPIFVPTNQGFISKTYICGKRDVDLNIDHISHAVDLYTRNDNDTLFYWYGISNKNKRCFHFGIKNYTDCQVIIYTDEKSKYLIHRLNKTNYFCPITFDILTAHAICPEREDVVFWSSSKITNEYLYDPYNLLNSSLFACPSNPKICLYDITFNSENLLYEKCGTKIYKIK